MKNIKYMIFLVVFILTASTISMGTGFAALENNSRDTVYVATNGDDNNDGSFDHPYQNIKTACDQVKPGGTVFLKKGTYKQYDIEIVEKSLKIVGENKDETIIDTGKKGLPIEVYYENNKDEFNNLTFKNIKKSCIGFEKNNWRGSANGSLIVDNCNFFNCNADTSDVGAAIWGEGNITVINSQFKDCISHNHGVIDVWGGNLFVSNCDFKNNINRNTEDRGSKISCDGGAIEVNCDFFIANSTFQNNTVFKETETSNGGAISLVDQRSLETHGSIFNCTFEYNSAPNGGAVACMYKHMDSSLNISYCKFIHNNALKGGAIYLKGILPGNVFGGQYDTNVFSDNMAQECPIVFYADKV